MWPFKKNKQIVLKDYSYGSFYDALLENGIQENFHQIADFEERNKQIKLFEKFRWHAFEGHLTILSPEIRNSFKSNSHPSQSHKFKEQAQEVLKELKQELQRFAFVKDAKLGFYHGDRIVFSIELNDDCDFEECYKKLPWLYKGFETKVK